MEKLKSSILNMVIVLTVVSLVAALVLALVNEVTTEPIRQQAINEINNGIKDVMSTPSLKVTNTDTISVSSFPPVVICGFTL